jgi:hypothetical protein
MVDGGVEKASIEHYVRKESKLECRPANFAFKTGIGEGSLASRDLNKAWAVRFEFIGHRAQQARPPGEGPARVAERDVGGALAEAIDLFGGCFVDIEESFLAGCGVDTDDASRALSEI